MEQKNLGHALAATAVLNFSTAAAGASDKVNDLTAPAIELEGQNSLLDSCADIEAFDDDSFDRDGNELEVFQALLAELIYNTANFCRPPELKAMHAAKRNVDEGERPLK